MEIFYQQGDAALVDRTDILLTDADLVFTSAYRPSHLKSIVASEIDTLFSNLVYHDITLAEDFSSNNVKDCQA